MDNYVTLEECLLLKNIALENIMLKSIVLKTFDQVDWKVFTDEEVLFLEDLLAEEG